MVSVNERGQLGSRALSTLATLALIGCAGEGSIVSDSVAPKPVAQAVPAVYGFTIDHPKEFNSLEFSFTVRGDFAQATKYCILENATDLALCVWNDFPLPATYTVTPVDGPKTLSFYVKDAVGNVSSRADSNTVVLDRTVPSLPSGVIAIPSSPSQVRTPLLKGALAADAAGLVVFSDAICAVEVGRGDRHAFTTVGVLAVADANATTTFTGRTYDAAGNWSGCTTLISYTHQSGALTPLTIGFLALTPSSPAATAPNIQGYASSDIQTVTIYSDSSCATVIGTGAKSLFEGSGIALSVPSNQMTVIYGKGQDSASGLTACTLLATFVHDSIAPPNVSGLSLASEFASVTSTPSVAWINGAVDLGSGLARYEYSIGTSAGATDVRTWTALAGGSPQSFGGLSLSNLLNYFINFRAIDNAGNVSAVTSGGWTVDIMPPAAPPVFSSFSPASPSVSVQNPRVIGTVGADTADVLLYSDAACTSLLAEGSRALFTSTGIEISVSANSTTTVFGRGQDSAGNISACSLLSSYTHDNTPPVLGALTIAGTYLASITANITFGGIGGGATQYCILENNTDPAFCAWTNFPVPSTYALAGTNGARQLSAWVRDAAGNASARTDSNTIILDTIAPAWSAPALTHAPTHNKPDTSPIAVYSQSATDANVYYYQYALGTGTTGSSITDIVSWTTVGSASFQLTALSLVDGATYYIRLRAIDVAGNATLSPINSGFTLNVVVPPPTFSSATPGSPNNTSGTPLITGQVDVSVETVGLFSNSTCGTALGSGTRADFIGSGISITVPADVNTSIYARATDATFSKNSACVFLTTYVFDTTAPLPPSTVDDSSWYNSTTSSPSIRWIGGGVDGGAGFNRFEYAIGSTVGGTDIRGWTSTGANSSVTATGLALIDGGQYFASVRAVDNVGNISVAVQADGWRVDTTTPVVGILQPAANEVVLTDRVMLSGTCDSSSPVAITYGAGASGVASAICVGGQFSASVTFTGIEGSRTMSIEQSDAAGNGSGSLTRTISWRPTFNTYADGLNNTVYTVSVTNDGSRRVLVGGAFLDLGGIATNRLVKLHYNGERDVAFSTGAGFNNTVYKILPTADGSGKFYVAGSFTDYDGTSLKYLVRLNSDGTVDSTFNLGSGFNGAVYTLEYGPGNKIFAGGAFTTVNGSALYPKLVLLNSDGSIDTSFDVSTGTGANGDVWSLRLSADMSSLFVGGAFTTYRGNTVNRVMRLIVANGTLAGGWATGPTAGFSSGIVYALILAPDNTAEIYVGGTFTQYGATPNSAQRIARLTSSGALSSTFNAAAGATQGFGATNVRALAAATDGTGDIIVGGDFTNWRGTVIPLGITRLTTTGAISSVFTARAFDAIVYSLEVPPVSINPFYDTLVGGNFTTYGSSGHSRLTRLNQNGTVDIALDPGIGVVGGSDYVRDVEFTRDYTKRMYIGGSFTTYRGVSANNFLRINADGSIDSTFNIGTGFGAAVTDSLVDPASNDVYVAGSFTFYNGGAAGSANRIIRLNSDGSVDSSFSIGTGFNSTVRKLLMDPTGSGKLYVVGDFTLYNGVGSPRIIRLNSDGSIDPTFNAGSGFNSSVYSIVPANDGTQDIYVGGLFTTYNGTSRLRVARLNNSGVLSGTFNAIDVNDDVYEIVTADDGTGDIYIGGVFTLVQGRSVKSLARLKSSGAFDGTFDIGLGLQYYNGTSYLGGVYGISKDSSGRILATGVFNRYFANTGFTLSRIVRLNPSGSIDATFNLGAGIDNTGYGFTTVPDGSGEFILYGDFTKFNGLNRGGLIRLRQNGDPN